MTNFQLSSEAQAIVNAYENTSDKYKSIANVLRSFIDTFLPEEPEAPKAVFDCEPRPSYNIRTNRCDGPLRYDHSAYLRLQFDQEQLNFRWEQRQQTRALMITVITELEQI